MRQQNNELITIQSTAVEPALSGDILSGHPVCSAHLLLRGRLLKKNICSPLITLTVTSIKRS